MSKKKTQRIAGSLKSTTTKRIRNAKKNPFKFGLVLRSEFGVRWYAGVVEQITKREINDD